MLACVQDESSETTAKTADEANTQSTKICVDYEPCKKTVGCSRMCLAGKRHRGMCVVNGKALKPDKMQTEDDEPKAGADRILRDKKLPTERRQHITPPPKKKQASFNKALPVTGKMLRSSSLCWSKSMHHA